MVSPCLSPSFPVAGERGAGALSDDEVADDHDCAKEDRQRIVAHKARLHPAQPGTILPHERSGLIDRAIDNPHVHLVPTANQRLV